MTVRWMGASAAALVLWGSSTGAEGVKAGDRVRLRVRGAFADTPRIGYVVEARPDALVIRSGDRDRPLTMSFASLERVEVARGKRRLVVEGLVAGAALGVVKGFRVGESAEGSAAAVMVGACGAAVGALVGLALETDRWKRVDTRPRIRLALVPGRGLSGGVGVSF